MKAKINFENVKAYIQGNIRKKIFFSKRFNWLLPLHIFEQINYRLFIMNKECYNNGECIHCGCSTPGLQMANKTCGAFCYPVMLDKTDWLIYKREYDIEFKYWDIKKSRDFDLRITHKTTI